MNSVQVNKLAPMVGATACGIVGGEIGSEIMTFRMTDGRWFRFYHSNDCCESVQINDVIGDIADLIGTPLVIAEQVSSDHEPPPESSDSYTWTFYRFATVRGTVTVRWLGESNGYYCETPAFASVTVSE